MLSRRSKQALNKVRKKIFSVLERRLGDIEELQQQDHDLLNELIVEERQRDTNRRESILPISEREVATRLFNDLIMYLDPNDIAVVPHIVFEGIWEREITVAWNRVLDGLKPKGSVVLDIGANFGYFGLLTAAKLSKDDAKVILFEANPKLLPYINKSLSVNWLNENTTVENLAISNTRGTAQLSVLADYVGSSSLHSVEFLKRTLEHKMHIAAQETVDVQTVTVDEYCNAHDIHTVSLIKMDIEGYEEKAYAGMKRVIRKSTDLVLFIEFTKDSYENPKLFYESMLTDFGHVYNIGSSGELIVPSSSTYEDLIAPTRDWTMLVFSKRDLVRQTGRWQ